MSLDFLTLISALVLAIIIFWLVSLSILYHRALRHYSKLTREVGGGDLKKILESHLEKLSLVNQELGDLAKETKSMKRDSRGYLQNVGMVRYNPYGDTGGDQSFAIALLDALGDGMVVSSLHGRPGTRIYGKPVKGGKETKYPLSDEEQRAIKEALTPKANVES